MKSIARAPALVIVAATIPLTLLALPFVGLLTDVRWTRLGEIIASDTVTEALRVTAIVVPISTVTVLILGTPVAWLLARYHGAWSAPIRALVLVPVVLPPVVSGLVLLSAFGRRGLSALVGWMVIATGSNTDRSRWTIFSMNWARWRKVSTPCACSRVRPTAAISICHWLAGSMPFCMSASPSATSSAG